MSLIAILTTLIFTKETNTGVSLGLNPKVLKRPSFQNFFPFTGFFLFFLWIILSVLWSGGAYGEWFHDVQSKLTILGTVVIFSLLPKFSNRDILTLHHIFGGTVLVGLLMVLWIYIPGYEDITLRIGRGRPIPTPIDHVRFSLMVAYASLSFTVFYLERKRMGSGPKEGFFMIVLSVVFFAYVGSADGIDFIVYGFIRVNHLLYFQNKEICFGWNDPTCFIDLASSSILYRGILP
jgi:hypothetical protein